VRCRRALRGTPLAMQAGADSLITRLGQRMRTKSKTFDMSTRNLSQETTGECRAGGSDAYVAAAERRNNHGGSRMGQAIASNKIWSKLKHLR
jgi:hypothetical protein